MNVKRLLAVLGLFAAASPTWAATTTTNFSVSGTVVPTCSVSATPLNFGAAIPNPINSNVDATSTITATCSTGAPYTITLGVGTGAGATYPARRMTSGPNTLVYSLYSDASRTVVWGNGGGGSAAVNGAGSGVAQPITVFGRIPSGQTVTTGSYSDTIVVTLTF